MLDQCLFSLKNAGISLLPLSTPTAESSLHVYTMLGKHTKFMFKLIDLTDEKHFTFVF